RILLACRLHHQGLLERRGDPQAFARRVCPRCSGTRTGASGLVAVEPFVPVPGAAVEPTLDLLQRAEVHDLRASIRTGLLDAAQALALLRTHRDVTTNFRRSHVLLLFGKRLPRFRGAANLPPPPGRIDAPAASRTNLFVFFLSISHDGSA